jgi:hypothetical protein
MNRIVLVALTLTTSVAAAEGEYPTTAQGRGEPNSYVAVGGILGEDRFEYNGIAGEVGMRIGRTPLFGRVMAHAGNASLSELAGRGTYAEGRGGVEVRACRNGRMWCGSLGLDLGIHRGKFERLDRTNRGSPKPADSLEEEDRFDMIEERFDTTVVAPRLTLDGGGRVRVRGVLELPHHIREGESVTGVAISLSLGVSY